MPHTFHPHVFHPVPLTGADKRWWKENGSKKLARVVWRKWTWVEEVPLRHCCDFFTWSIRYPSELPLFEHNRSMSPGDELSCRSVFFLFFSQLRDTVNSSLMGIRVAEVPCAPLVGARINLLEEIFQYSILKMSPRIWKNPS